MYWRGDVLENNTRYYIKKKERKIEQWEDKSSYIHKSSSPDIALNRTLPFLPYFIVQQKVPSLMP
jgi:hypothetical protein